MTDNKSREWVGDRYARAIPMVARDGVVLCSEIVLRCRCFFYLRPLLLLLLLFLSPFVLDDLERDEYSRELLSDRELSSRRELRSDCESLRELLLEFDRSSSYRE